MMLVYAITDGKASFAKFQNAIAELMESVIKMKNAYVILVGMVRNVLKKIVIVGLIHIVKAGRVSVMKDGKVLNANIRNVITNV